MSKYDFEVDLSLNSSTGIILNKIAPKSTVLEFGCASGRMTKYMKDMLDCQVYIVEYDKEAYDTAIAYAADGLCDDILNFKWMEQFKEIQFDAIIFSDVLEHLSAPEKVLENAAMLLKESGKVYISIPNITHNDIMLKAYTERFDYTATGILDDTHIHFWGLENLPQLAQQSGLTLKSIEATYCPTGYTEQFAEDNTIKNILLENLLKERKCGEIYQFILTLDKSVAADPVYKINASSIKSHIYFDTGNDFNANEVVEVEAIYFGDGVYKLHYVINDTDDLKRVKFDPVEGQSCILRHISIVQENAPLELISANAVALKEGLLLLGTDPMVYANTHSNGEAIYIDADIIVAGDSYISLLQEAYVEQQETKRKNGVIERYAQKIAEEKHAIALELQKTLEEKYIIEQKLRNSEKQTANFEKIIAEMRNENDTLRAEINAYIHLATKKDKYALALKQDIAELTKYKTILPEKESYIIALEQDREYYKNLKVVKVRMFIVRIIKRIIKLFRKSS